MASQRTKFAVGLFVASGIGIAAVAIIWLGASRFLEKGQYYVTYFDESVQGLDVDSPVKYRGVPIGRVERIGVAPDSKLIEVVLRIESGQALDKSIVAQLRSVGITGSVFVELDRKTAGEPDRSPTVTFPTKYPIVASKPSEVQELLRGLDDVLKQIRSLDLEGISGDVKLTLANINQMIADVNVKGLSKDFELSLKRVTGILDKRRWDKIVTSVEEAAHSLNVLMNKADQSLSQAENTLVRVEAIVADNKGTIKTAIDDFKRAMENANLFMEKGSLLMSGANDSVNDLRRHLVVVAQNLERASENINRLIDLLSDQPSQLIFGQPPTPREVEQEVER